LPRTIYAGARHRETNFRRCMETLWSIGISKSRLLCSKFH
jgi:hypothetical protein